MHNAFSDYIRHLATCQDVSKYQHSQVAQPTGNNPEYALRVSCCGKTTDHNFYCTATSHLKSLSPSSAGWYVCMVWYAG